MQSLKRVFSKEPSIQNKVQESSEDDQQDSGTTSYNRMSRLLSTEDEQHGSFKERQDKMLSLEQYLRSHDRYSKLFRENPERTMVTDDSALSLDLNLIHKFLAWKKYNYSAAQKSITNWIDWRLKEKPHKITLDEVWEEYVTGKAYWLGHDKNGLPVCIMRPNLHYPSKRDKEQCRRFVIWVAEEGSRLVRQCGQEHCAVIYDASKISMKNLDLSMFQTIFAIFNMYPDMMKYVLVLPTFTFWALWKIGKPLLDTTTKSKIQFINSTADLLDYISSDNLEQCFGGTLSFDFTEHVREVGARDAE